VERKTRNDQTMPLRCSIQNMFEWFMLPGKPERTPNAAQGIDGSKVQQAEHKATALAESVCAELPTTKTTWTGCQTNLIIDAAATQTNNASKHERTGGARDCTKPSTNAVAWMLYRNGARSKA
jgi:hypothetical protein